MLFLLLLLIVFKVKLLKISVLVLEFSFPSDWLEFLSQSSEQNGKVLLNGGHSFSSVNSVLPRLVELKARAYTLESTFFGRKLLGTDE